MNSAAKRSQALQGLVLRHSVRDLTGANHMTEAVIDEIILGVTLHEIIDACEIGPLRDYVLDRLRQPLLAMGVLVGRDLLGWRGEFYVDDYLILRINFPYLVARHADQSAENPGIGRLSASVRRIFRARQLRDAVYDPKSYHRGQPPAAWAHGPHLDSWTGHSRDGCNIWLAISEVPTGCSMVLYPELADETLPVDPRTLYIKAGYQLPKPTYLPLQAGEMLVFDPEVLHGTRLNTTKRTRVAVSLRLNASKPKFDPSCFYAREFWRRASDIEAGKDEVLHLPREDNLEGPRHLKPTPPASLPVIFGRLDHDKGIIHALVNDAAVTAQRLIVDAGEHRFMVVRIGEGLKAYSAACPHYGIDLADGGSDESTHIVQPAPLASI
jgi:hypothetical protein